MIPAQCSIAADNRRPLFTAVDTARPDYRSGESLSAQVQFYLWEQLLHTHQSLEQIKQVALTVVDQNKDLSLDEAFDGVRNLQLVLFVRAARYVANHTLDSVLSAITGGYITERPPKDVDRYKRTLGSKYHSDRIKNQVLNICHDVFRSEAEVYAYCARGTLDLEWHGEPYRRDQSGWFAAIATNTRQLLEQLVGEDFLAVRRAQHSDIEDVRESMDTISSQQAS
jgi:hypothetical protein